MSEQDSSSVPASSLHIAKFKSPSSLDGDKMESEESISDNDLDKIVGVADSSELEVLAVYLCLFFYFYFWGS